MMKTNPVTNSSAELPTELPTEKWSTIVEAYPEANFLQSPAWAETNRAIGHKICFNDFGDRGWCLMIVKNAKRGRYLEVPGGPLLDWQNKALVEEAFATIRKVARQEKCVFIRLRPQLFATSAHLDLLANLGCKKAPMHLHAEHTVMIDLTKTEDELLADMRRQTRYEVRRSKKQAITVEWSDDLERFSEFHDAQVATAKRQGFVPPDLDTLLAEREAFGDQIRLYTARTTDGQPIAYGLIFWSGLEAEYFEAASTDLNRKMPGAYALQWQVMQDLKSLNLKRYNLWGIAPQGAVNHRYSGVTTFKTGFGGEIVEFVPAQDIIINRAGYLKDWAVETIRRKTRNL